MSDTIWEKKNKKQGFAKRGVCLLANTKSNNFFTRKYITVNKMYFIYEYHSFLKETNVCFCIKKRSKSL